MYLFEKTKKSKHVSDTIGLFANKNLFANIIGYSRISPN